MKIVICGGLGYIGSAMVELYRNETDHEIVVLDKKFIPHLVANLPPHVRFIEGNILDEGLVKKVLDGADIVYQLAAEVEAEKSVLNEEAIWRNNYEATLIVIAACGPQTRLLFPSTGNVFGGVNEKEKFMDLTEEDEPRPKYPYAESKRAIEKYLLAGGNGNFTIVRFGTNYGYAPGIRFNLVTNLFIKRVIQGQDVTVHGSGENYRPTVHVSDAAGGAKYLAKSPESQGQIYHVVRQSYKIRELAEAVVNFNPRAKVNHIAKEVPFSSYHLSSKKLLDRGYEFTFDLESGIEQVMKVFGQMR